MYSAPTWLPFRGSLQIGCAYLSQTSRCKDSDYPKGYHTYWAIDFVGTTSTAANGKPVYAAGAGQVKAVATKYTGCSPKTESNFVLINHNGSHSRYSHLATVLVKNDQWVDEFTQIGTIGQTGLKDDGCWAHLHYEKRKKDGSTKTDPGKLRACQSAVEVAYPDATGGGTSWHRFPGHAYTAKNDGPVSRTATPCVVQRKPAVATSIDLTHDSEGRLELYGIGTDIPDGKVWRRAQITPGGGTWGTWSLVDGFGASIAVETNLDGRIELFVVGTDGRVSRRAQVAPGGAWGPWSFMTNEGAEAIAATRNGEGRIELFVVGTNGRISRIAQTTPGGGWGSWFFVGGGASLIATTTNVDGRIELFVVGTDGRVSRTAQVAPGGAWGPWSFMTNEGTSAIAAARNGEGRIELFVVGTNQRISQVSQTAPGGAWGSWSFVDGGASCIGAEANADGRIELVVVGTDGRVSRRTQITPGGAWGQWAFLDGGLKSGCRTASP